ncbi:MAG: phage holin family protein [Methanobrevibacter sp.]|nr:phage holin family protein [Methanobrevibacter sp.]
MDIIKQKQIPKRNLKRSLIVFIGNVLGIYLICFLELGVKANFEDIIILVLFISLINALFWPILTRIAMPFLVLTLGFGTLILNGLLLQFFAPLFEIEIKGFAIILAPLSMAIVTTVLSALITIDDDSSYYRAVLRDAEKKRKTEIKGYPGVIIVEIDGLAYEVLCEAVERGDMPTVKEMIDSDNYNLRMWETDLSSQTGASQAGILHGNNEGIVAFRWVEKSNGNQMMQCSGITEVPKLEQRISDGNGLLVDNGASRSNLFSGDTDNVIFTFSKIMDFKKLYNKAWYSVFSNPSYFARILTLFLADMIREIWSQIIHSIKNIRPRIKRGIKYIPRRAATNVFMREINTSTLIGDMMIGDVDVAYSTYLGYDEIAHHSGVRDNDAWFALREMDKQIKHLTDANKYCPRDYQFVIQSDHGQTNGATFTQRYGETFENFVKSLLPKDMTIFAKMTSNEDHFAEDYTPFSRKNKKIEKAKKEEQEVSDSEVIVLASGNLAMIYLTQWNQRLTYEELNTYFPELIPGLINNEYVGFILVKSQECGDLAIGKNGTYFLDSDEIEGENPLEGFGDNIVRHLKRTSSFEHTPDILVNSFYDEETDEVCAFEELVGSHGGAGGDQSKPFILYPSSWNVSDEQIIGAENIYKLLKDNLAELKK